MLELVKSKLQIKIDTQVYDVKAPTYKDTLNYQEKIKDCADDAHLKAECLFNYLDGLGLPKDVTQNLEISQVSKIVDYLSGEKKS